MGKVKKAKAVVRGPQLALKLPRAKGEPPRTARMRFVEPPTKAKGNPFVAVRVPREALAQFKRYCVAHKKTTSEILRSFVLRCASAQSHGVPHGK